MRFDIRIKGNVDNLLYPSLYKYLNTIPARKRATHLLMLANEAIVRRESGNLQLPTPRLIIPDVINDNGHPLSLPDKIVAEAGLWD